ncbi:MAG: peptidylprolyl isomerase [Elusimicrobia bacterium]|nr:peptidylprolyl isomerase [Elusimicrobiota bacterium]
MSNSSKLLAAWVLALAIPAGAALVEDTVATVNGIPILKTEYQKNLDSVFDQYKRTAPQLLNDKDTVAQIRRKVLDQMIDDKLFEAEAERRKIKIHEREVDQGITEVREKNFRQTAEGKTLSDEEVEKALNEELKKEGVTPSAFRERIRKQMMIRKVMDEVVRPKVKPPEETDVRKAFERIRFIVKGDTAAVAGLPERDAQAYMALGQRVKDLSGERVLVAHILAKVGPKASMVEKTAALKKIEDLKKQLESDDADFAELAKKHSDDKESSDRGGDLGFVLRGWMPSEFEKVAFGLPVGEVSEPVETQFGYHLIRVREKKAAERVTFDKLKDDLAQFLFNVSLEKELEKTAQDLRKQAQIEIKLPTEEKKG